MPPFRRATLETEKNNAFLIYSDFGPNLRILRLEQLTAESPGQSAMRLTGWIEDFKAVDASIWELAREGGPRGIGKEESSALLLSRHPFLRQSGLDKAWSRGGYYACHDGWLPSGTL
jgi:hypothetical protein